MFKGLARIAPRHSILLASAVRAIGMPTSRPISNLSHLERTAEEPRDVSLHPVTISQIQQVNPTIRLFRLQPSHTCPTSRTTTTTRTATRPLTFQPGQWLDVYVPGIPKAGGFTITSSPSKLLSTSSSSSSSPYLELAIQKSPSNPPAAWLWRADNEILGQELHVRVGGSFVWPPKVDKINRVIFIAGGVGINPFMSMLSFIEECKTRGGRLGFEIKFLYSTKVSDRTIDDKVLFMTRLQEAFETIGDEGELRLFVTGGSDGNEEERGASREKGTWFVRRRISEIDILDALGPVEGRGSTVCYICGVPGMTDQFVDVVKKAKGMVHSNVLYEKWW